jgi:hypothetical protein
MPLTQNKQESAAAKWERIKSMGGAEKQEELRKAKVDLGPWPCGYCFKLVLTDISFCRIIRRRNSPVRSAGR